MARGTASRYAKTIIFIVVLVGLFSIYRRSPTDVLIGPLPSPSISLPAKTIRSHDFRFYPQSRAELEYQRLQLNDDFSQMFDLSTVSFDSTINPSKILSYSETTFRSAPFPIIWLDARGDVRWNHKAQNEFFTDLLEKQFPSINPSECLSRPLFVIDQWPMGFFSRYHCFIEQFGQTLYSSSMALLMPRSFAVSGAGQDDFRKEGILRYYQSLSLCQSYLTDPKLKQLRDQLPSIGFRSQDTKIVNSVNDLLDTVGQKQRFKYSREIWIFGYDHVPHRRWLFDRQRTNIREKVRFNSSIPTLIDHSNEHIYSYNGPLLNLSAWRPRNYPQSLPKYVLPGTTTNLTLNDHIFSSYLRYMFILFFSPLAPRIQYSARLLAQHWSEYLSDRLNVPYDKALQSMAAIFIRRGDKMPEDSFWQKHRRWRNISMYVKGMIDEETRRQMKFNSIFVMTDDLSVMNSIQEYARVGLTGAQKDESYARQYLHNRQILYNVFAPQACFDPFIRIGFDQFLVNVQFIADYASFVVSHKDSNVGRYLEELIYVKRQHQPNAQTLKFVANAPDTLD